MNDSPHTADRFGYDAAAERYARHADQSAYNVGYERPAVHHLLGDVLDLAVLDAGCAAGSHLLRLRADGARAVGIDLSIPLLAIARRRVPSAPIVAADFGQGLPFADRAFDVVLCSLALHYQEDWSATLDEFARVLRPSGRLVLSTHHPVWDWPQRNTEDYFDTGWISTSWPLMDGTSMDVRFHRKTIGEVLTAIATRFRIEEVLEPLPDSWVGNVRPDIYKALRYRPAFLLVAARKAT